MKEVAAPSTAESTSAFDVPDQANGTNEPRRRKLMRLAANELEQLRPGALLAQSISGLLPQFCFNRLRTALWRAAKVSIGEGSLIMGDVLLSGSGDWSSLLSIGEHTYITGPLRINLGGSVRIGSGVNIGHDCLFLTVDHEIGPEWRRAGWSTHGPVVIEDGCWIASRVTILPGVTVGRGAVVAAGAVVSANVEPDTLVAGVPAKPIRSLHGACAGY
jgi:serine acetyltransferase